MKEAIIKVMSHVPIPIKNYLGNIYRKYTYRKRIEDYWRKIYGREFDWNNPKNYNEKVIWLELNSDTSLWTQLTDKLLVREYVKKWGGENILPKIIKVYNNVEEIDFDELPQKCVLKCNHDSGSTVVIDKSKPLDIRNIKEFLSKKMNTKFGDVLCELHYNKIKPYIFAEEYIDSDYDSITQTTSLIDYKFHCFSGIIDCCVVCYDRKHGDDRHATFDIYDVSPWKPRRDLIPSELLRTLKLRDIPEPQNLKEMIRIVETLSKNINQVRVDLYSVNNKIYFGEMTFTPTAARINYLTEEKLLEMGDKIKI